jgi:FO synthase
MSCALNAVVVPAHLRRIRPQIRVPLEHALDGGRINEAEAQVLIDTEAPDEVGALIAVAGHLRTRLHGTVITFSPKVFLPITNVCRNRCSYCTFRSDPDDAHAWTMAPDEIRTSSRNGRALGCIEALMCLGDKPELAFDSYRATLRQLGHTSTLAYVHQACEIALEEGLLPHTNAGLMSREELASLKAVNVSMGLMLENVSPRLRRKGEAHYYSPDKDPERRLVMMRHAGELRIPLTTGILIGIGETRAERVASLGAIRDLHRDYGHIQEVIIQNFRAKPTTAMVGRHEPDSLDIARTIAVARLMLGGMNIQAPPNLSPYDHRLLLAAGINDWGGISPLSPDYVNPEAPWPHIAALAETCRAQGFILQRRLPIYSEFIDRPGFLESSLQRLIAERAAESGAQLC